MVGVFFTIKSPGKPNYTSTKTLFLKRSHSGSQVDRNLGSTPFNTIRGKIQIRRGKLELEQQLPCPAQGLLQAPSVTCGVTSRLQPWNNPGLEGQQSLTDPLRRLHDGPLHSTYGLLVRYVCQSTHCK